MLCTGQYDYSGYMPNRPSMITKPMPEKHSLEVEARTNRFLLLNPCQFLLLLPGCRACTPLHVELAADELTCSSKRKLAHQNT